MTGNRCAVRREEKRRNCLTEIAENSGKRARERERILFIGDIFEKPLVFFTQVYYNKHSGGLSRKIP